MIMAFKVADSGGSATRFGLPVVVAQSKTVFDLPGISEVGRSGGSMLSSGLAYFYYRFVPSNKSEMEEAKDVARRSFEGKNPSGGLLVVATDTLLYGREMIAVKISLMRPQSPEEFLKITDELTRIGATLRNKYEES
jgi:hypothetical protein